MPSGFSRRGVESNNYHGFITANIPCCMGATLWQNDAVTGFETGNSALRQSVLNVALVGLRLR